VDDIKLLIRFAVLVSCNCHDHSTLCGISEVGLFILVILKLDKLVCDNEDCNHSLLTLQSVRPRLTKATYAECAGGLRVCTR